MYTNFAYIYDKLTADVNYSKWVDYIEDIFSARGIKPSLVLDLGCGTGSFCIEMAKRGYQMIGIDSSEDMLACAKQKSLDAGSDILLLNQDMADFELYGTVDVIVSLMDSINYITHKNDVKRLFKLVRNYLNPGGLFIFDINSAYKLETVLGNNVFYEVGDDVSYIWANKYDSKKKICEFDLTFFIRDGEYYGRWDEIHAERAYEVDELKRMAEASGLEVMDVFAELKFTRPTSKSNRIFFVCGRR